MCAVRGMVARVYAGGPRSVALAGEEVLFLVGPHRELKVERGALARYRCGPAAAAMLLHDALYDGQADASAFELIGSVQAFEHAEDLFALRGIEAHAIVLHPDHVVVGMRLGCLNHALLTAEAITSRGLALAGWVANHVDPQMAAAEENVRALETLISAPLLARIAFAVAPDPASGAALLDTRKLL